MRSSVQSVRYRTGSEGGADIPACAGEGQAGMPTPLSLCAAILAPMASSLRQIESSDESAYLP